MKVNLGPEDRKAEELLPEKKPDGSGIGVNYADAYIKAIKLTLEDGRKISCKRRGLQLTLQIGDRSGKGILRRLEHGPDARRILLEALKEAARDAGTSFSVQDGIMTLELD